MAPTAPATLPPLRPLPLLPMEVSMKPPQSRLPRSPPSNRPKGTTPNPMARRSIFPLPLRPSRRRHRRNWTRRQARPGCGQQGQGGDQQEGRACPSGGRQGPGEDQLLLPVQARWGCGSPRQGEGQGGDQLLPRGSHQRSTPHPHSPTGPHTSTGDARAAPHPRG